MSVMVLQITDNSTAFRANSKKTWTVHVDERFALLDLFEAIT